MKICWNNLKGIYLSKNGNLRKGSNTYIEMDSCIRCGDPYLAPNSKQRDYCSRERALGSEEVRLKMSKTRKGRTFSESHKMNLSKSLKKSHIGRKHPMLGKENKWGRHTRKTKQKLSELLSGENHPMFGKRGKETAMFGRRNKWGNHTEQTKLKMSLSKRGNRHPNWKGGIAPFNVDVRNLFEYKIWRECVFKRDHYTCKRCYDSSGGNLVAHHIIKLSNVLTYYNIKTLDEARDCLFLWLVQNGITLCEDCHKVIHTNRIEEV